MGSWQILNAPLSRSMLHQRVDYTPYDQAGPLAEEALSLAPPDSPTQCDALRIRGNGSHQCRR